jgi:hypothetical protein
MWMNRLVAILLLGAVLVFFHHTGLGSVLRTKPDVFHGTINIVLANRNGIVVLTDSKLTGPSGPVERPGKKLFRVDDRTVCAIAGFIAAPGPIAQFFTDSGAIIEDYAAQISKKPPLRFQDKLMSIAMLISHHLSTIATLNKVSGDSVPTKNYRLQLTLAGYDLDGSAKIGQVSLEPSEEGNFISSDVHQSESVVVSDRLTYMLAGMPDVASAILLQPDVESNDPTFQMLADAIHNDGGSSLSLKQLVQVASNLAKRTSAKHAEVGGANQIAVLADGSIQSFESGSFEPFEKGIMDFSVFIGGGLFFLHGLQAQPHFHSGVVSAWHRRKVLPLCLSVHNSKMILSH